MTASGLTLRYDRPEPLRSDLYPSSHRRVRPHFATTQVACESPLVPGERFELPTNGLQKCCSTTELTRQINELQNRSSCLVLAVSRQSYADNRPPPSELPP